MSVGKAAFFVRLAARIAVLSLVFQLSAIGHWSLGLFHAEAGDLASHAAHCHGDRAAQDAILAGVDSIEHGSFLQPDTLQEMKRRGVVLVPTLMAVESVERKARENKFPPLIAQKALAAAGSLYRTFRTAVQLGLSIGMGTDSGVSQHGHNAHEITLMVKNGMSPAQALQAATVVDAKLLQMEDRIGKLAPGYLADVIAVPGDVLQDPSAVERVALVVKGGRVMK